MRLPLTLLVLLTPSAPHALAAERAIPELMATVEVRSEAAAEQPPQKPKPKPGPQPKPRPRPHPCFACGMG
jgi:hypothetical protein